MRERELLFAGFGGQGVLTAGLIVAQIALYRGYFATWMPSYGAAMRGGTANCTVHYSKEFIFNPGRQEPDLLLAMNMPSYEKFRSLVRPGGVVIANADIVQPAESEADGVNILMIPCNTIADQLGNPKGANIVMVGAMMRWLGDVSQEEGVAGMNDMFHKKGKEKFEALNEAAFCAGYAYPAQG